MRSTDRPAAHRFFERLVRHPRKILVAALALVVAVGAFLPRIEKDTRSDAFVPPGHAFLVRRDEVRERFCLSDPIVVALFDDVGRERDVGEDELGVLRSHRRSVARLIAADHLEAAQRIALVDVVAVDVVVGARELVAAHQQQHPAVRRGVVEIETDPALTDALDGVVAAPSTIVALELDMPIRSKVTPADQGR